MAVFLDYKPTRYEGKGFLHRDITGEMWFGVGWHGISYVLTSHHENDIKK